MRNRKGISVVTARPSENQLADLTVYAISQQLRKDYRTAITDTRIAKILFDVAKNLDLPITRSWYKYGTYVWWSDNASEKRLKEFLGILPPTSDTNITVNLANGEMKALYDQILGLVSKHRLMLREDISSFLTELYLKEAPKGLGNLYLANKKLLDRCDKVLDSIWKNDPGPQFMIVSKEITDLHKALFNFENMKEMIDLVIDGTSLLEDMLITYETNQDDLSRLKDFAKVFEEVFNFYKDNIWTFPASAIAIRTVDGPRATQVKDNRNSYLMEAPQYRDRVSELSGAVLSKGFYPTREDIMIVQERMSKRLSSNQKALKQVFAEQLLVRR
jgi:hypothetical protein